MCGPRRLELAARRSARALDAGDGVGSGRRRRPRRFPCRTVPLGRRASSRGPLRRARPARALVGHAPARRTRARARCPPTSAEQGRAELVVVGAARKTSWAVRVPAELVAFDDRSVRERVLLVLPLGRAPPRGAILEATIRIAEPRTAEDGGFDERAWLARQGIHVVARARSWEQIATRGGIAGLGDGLRDRIEAAVDRGTTGLRRALVLGVVLGEDEGLSEKVRDDFRASGLAHLLAVSGTERRVHRGRDLRARLARAPAARLARARRPRGDRRSTSLPSAGSRRSCVPASPGRWSRSRGSSHDRATAGTSSLWERSSCSRGRRRRCSNRASSSRSRPSPGSSSGSLASAAGVGGVSDPAACRRGTRHRARVRARHCADRPVPLRIGAAVHGAGERARGARAAARARARPARGRSRPDLTGRGDRPCVARRLGGCLARARRPSHGRACREPRSGRGRRSCFSGSRSWQPSRCDTGRDVASPAVVPFRSPSSHASCRSVRRRGRSARHLPGTRRTGFRATFLDVGQGDSVLLETASARVLVDEGPPEADVAGQLRAPRGAVAVGRRPDTPRTRPRRRCRERPPAASRRDGARPGARGDRPRARRGGRGRPRAGRPRSRDPRRLGVQGRRARAAGALAGRRAGFRPRTRTSTRR